MNNGIYGRLLCVYSLVLVYVKLWFTVCVCVHSAHALLEFGLL